jgi:hypothetical protein
MVRRSFLILPLQSLTFRAKLIAADEVNELGVNDLHVFHSLVFQHKDKYLPLFGKEEHKNEFLKLLEKIGSYDKKVSFSFLGEVEQKEVKKIMSARNDEASYIGYVTMPNKKGEQEKQILIVGMHRIIWATPKGKVLQDFHQFLLRSVTSLAPNALTLGFKDTEITQSSDEVDIIVDCIRRSVEFCFHGMPQDRKPIIKVQPASRLIETPRSTHKQIIITVLVLMRVQQSMNLAVESLLHTSLSATSTTLAPTAKCAGIWITCTQITECWISESSRRSTSSRSQTRTFSLSSMLSPTITTSLRLCSNTSSSPTSHGQASSR